MAITAVIYNCDLCSKWVTSYAVVSGAKVELVMNTFDDATGGGAAGSSNNPRRIPRKQRRIRPMVFLSS